MDVTILPYKLSFILLIAAGDEYNKPGSLIKLLKTAYFTNIFNSLYRFFAFLVAIKMLSTNL